MDKQGKRDKPYALAAGEGWTIPYGIDFTIKASEVQASSGAAFLEYVTRKGEEPPRHTHATEDEMFYVLRGRSPSTVAKRISRLNPAGLSFCRAAWKHGYTIRSAGDVRLIVVTAPVRNGVSGGWGGFVADMEQESLRK